MTATAPTYQVDIDFTTDLAATNSYAEQLLGTGPYVYHRLQESAGTSATDASGNAVTGTYAGTYTLDQTASKPVSGETASRYVLLGGGAGGAAPGRVNFTGPNQGLERMTWMGWVRQDSLDGSAATSYIIFENDGSTTFQTLFELKVQGDGKVKLTVGAVSVVTNAAQVSASTFTHVTATIDGPNQTGLIYINGAPVATTTTISSGTVFGLVGSAPVTTWRWGTDINTALVSPIDRLGEPAFWLRVVDATEITAIYGALAVAPFSGYTWTNVTAYVTDTSLQRRFGRETALEDVTPMELTFELNNRDRRFEPEYVSSPYYPNVVPGRPCRVRMTQDAVTYDWAFGFIEDFPQVWGTGLHGRVPIVARCYLARMNRIDNHPINAVQQLAGAREGLLLNIADFPLANRTLDAGANQMMAAPTSTGSLGAQVLQVARSDRGLFYFNGAGHAVFQDGSYRTTNGRATAAQGTLGLLPDEMQYNRPEFHAPLGLVRNEITLRRPGGVDQIETDRNSQRRYGEQTYQDELLLTTDAAMATRAADLLADYKDPSLRVRSVTFNPGQGAGFWSHALGVRLSDRYRWKFQPPVGAGIERDVFVEGVEDSYADNEYLATWFLSTTTVPATVAGSFRGLLALTS